MNVDSATLFAFTLVFIRCSAMLLASPVFGSQSTPAHVRIFIMFAISASLTCVVKPHIGPLPGDLWTLAGAGLREALSGLLIGGLIALVVQAAEIAGAILDVQMGLGISQVLNPVSGISVTILSQFKFMLATVVFLCANGHHRMIEAFVSSYSTMPGLGLQSMPAIKDTFLSLLGTTFLLALQIATPVLAVTLVVDAALGLVNKAVPQMQVLLVGAPAKATIGMMTVGLALPALAAAVTAGVGTATDAITHLFHP